MNIKTIVGIFVVLVAGGFLAGCIDSPQPEVVKETISEVEVITYKAADTSPKAQLVDSIAKEADLTEEDEELLEDSIELIEALTGNPTAIKDLAVEFIQSEDFLLDEDTLKEHEEWEEDVEEVINDVWNWLLEE